MVESLSPSKPESEKAHVLVDEGVEQEEKGDLSKAASELGKEGGKAAAKARAAEAKKQAKAPATVPLLEADAEALAETAAAVDEADRASNPRHDPKARMLEATRQAADAKRQLATERAEREQERAELAHYRAQVARARQEAQPAERQAPPANGADKKPEEGDFDNYGDFVEARSRHAAREEFAQLQQRAEAQHQAQSYHQELDSRVTKFNERVTGLSMDDPQQTAKFEEFMSKVDPRLQSLQPTFTLPDPRRFGPGNVIADEIFRSEQAPALMLHFTEHPEELQRIATLKTPWDISREMAKLEARIESRSEAVTAGTSSTPAVSKANPPVRPVTGAPQTDRGELDDSAPLSAFVQRSGQRFLRSSGR